MGQEARDFVDTFIDVLEPPRHPSSWEPRRRSGDAPPWRSGQQPLVMPTPDTAASA